MPQPTTRRLLSGLFCLAFGGFVVWQGYRYSIGTLRSMGPGFLPVTLGVLLTIIGVGMVIQSFRDSELVERVNLRPLIMVTLAIVAFALTIRRFGFLPAAALSVFISGLAQKNINKIHLLILTVALIVVVYTIFGLILRMPIDLVRWRP